MPPHSSSSLMHHSYDILDLTLLEKASRELAMIHHDALVPFPRYCLELVKMNPGNDRCVDCDTHSPDWASVSYGALICMRCSGRHRSLGVQFSKVRSLRMDHWSHAEILRMLEGGNKQLGGFFDRHSLSTRGSDGMDNLKKRYRTKAALFYRSGMDQHVVKISETGNYRGRKESRRLSEDDNVVESTPQTSTPLRKQHSI